MAELTNYEDKVHFDLAAGKSIARIVCKDGQIGLEPLADDLVMPEQKLEPTKKNTAGLDPEKCRRSQSISGGIR